VAAAAAVEALHCEVRVRLSMCLLVCWVATLHSLRAVRLPVPTQGQSSRVVSRLTY